MKKNLIIWQVAGLTSAAILGTLLHFLFQWTNLNFIAPFSAVNESTWEHMKLVFIPSLIFAFVQSFFAKKEYPCFWLIKLIGILVGTLLIPILFYSLSGIFGKLPAVINVLIFFVSIIIEYLLEFFMFNKLSCNINLNILYVSILITILLLFIIFTFYPPKIPLFLDPVTNRYGIVNYLK